GFSTEDFEYDDASAVPGGALPGVAGFRLHTPLNRADIFDELVVFQGASYFRGLGRGNTYGLSARGLALNTALPEGEEFPRFSRFWVERPLSEDRSVTLYAALDSPSVTGAYRFVITPGANTTMDVTARVFVRQDVAEIGIAPLTSMFLFGGADRGPFDDFRLAVHDSEALVINGGDGATLYRPLTNPPQLGNAYFDARGMQSFGLVQRARAFEDYLDAEAQYGKRPSLMVEPLGDWGPGSVRLVEIPSDLEVNDNIVAYWVPEGVGAAGTAVDLSYRLHWGLTPPGAQPANLARVVRTLAGEGGVAGVERDPDANADSRKFVIDFAGGLLGTLPGNAALSPEVWAQGGEVIGTALSQVAGKDIWRLVVELRADPGAIVEVRAAIAGFDRTLSETWAYQWIYA
ncbi:MAG: glucan biosynthesis protein G, partial [Pseudomonadota bacterium]